jgi:CBS domain-containing protein
MHLLDIVIPTGTAAAGMTVREAFIECVERNVPGLPFVDDLGKVVGRVSIRHTLKMTCIPEYMVKAAHLLGDAIDHLALQDDEIRLILDLPIDEFVLEDVAHLSAASPIVKALSVMEYYNTGYVFLCDDERYRGIVTRMGIARVLLNRSPVI